MVEESLREPSSPDSSPIQVPQPEERNFSEGQKGAGPGRITITNQLMPKDNHFAPAPPPKESDKD